MYYRSESDTLEQSAGNRMTEKLLHGRTLLHTDAIANMSFLHTRTRIFLHAHAFTRAHTQTRPYSNFYTRTGSHTGTVTRKIFTH
jgi:3-isopropylmalate dehydratase small subunit